MKLNLLLIALIILASCSSQPSDEVMVFKILTRDTTIDIHKTKPDVFFNRGLINYLVEKFPAASNVIFNRYDSSNLGIKLNDSTYEYGIVSDRNRIYLINSLPKDLTEEQSDSYFKRPGFFAYKNLMDLAKQDSIFEERTKWTKAPKEIEGQYLRFYALLRTYSYEYLIVAPKEVIESAPW